MKKVVIIFLSVTISSFLPLLTLAQEIDITTQEEEKPEEVIKLEELIIELEPLEVFTIPRMEAELPPIDFIGVFRRGFLKPRNAIFTLKKEDKASLKANELEKMLAKKKK